jgi:PilZ domain
MLRPSHHPERRSRARVSLVLPLDYQAIGSSNTYGGIVIDGSEGGLFIYSLRDMPVGTQLRISVLFADGFELTNFKATAKIVRKIRSNNGRKGYEYGLKLLRVDEGSITKFTRLLTNHIYKLVGRSSEPSLIVNSGAFPNTKGWQPKKQKKRFLSFLLNLLKIY